MQNPQERALEIERLAEEYHRSRDRSLRNQLAEAHLYIARVVARKFAGRGVEFDDLFQVASMALLKTIERYEPERGVKLASYVTPSMIGEVKNYFRDRARLIRLPRNSAETAARLMRASERLTAELMRAPTAAELAREMGASLEEVLEALEARSAMQVRSLDAAVSDDEDAASLADILGAEEKGFAAFEDGDAVRRAMEGLEAREREVVRLRFFGRLSQQQAAERLDVSQMTISRIERSALKKLRRALDGTESKEV